MRFPALPNIEEYVPTLTKMVAATGLLPCKSVVAAFDGAVFPTARYRSGHPRFTEIIEGNAPVGMYDDNATPEWAICWSHGITGTRPQGWTVAHVWPESDRHDYTHIANLILVPEPFATLTDKHGPLTPFLRWHAWRIYHWRPANEPEPVEPPGYAGIEWRYLNASGDPRAAVEREIGRRDNQRVRILRPIMRRLGMPWAGADTANVVTGDDSRIVSR